MSSEVVDGFPLEKAFRQVVHCQQPTHFTTLATRKLRTRTRSLEINTPQMAGKRVVLADSWWTSLVRDAGYESSVSVGGGWHGLATTNTYRRFSATLSLRVRVEAQLSSTNAPRIFRAICRSSERKFSSHCAPASVSDNFRVSPIPWLHVDTAEW